MQGAQKRSCQFLRWLRDIWVKPIWNSGATLLAYKCVWSNSSTYYVHGTCRLKLVTRLHLWMGLALCEKCHNWKISAFLFQEVELTIEIHSRVQILRKQKVKKKNVFGNFSSGNRCLHSFRITCFLLSLESFRKSKPNPRRRTIIIIFITTSSSSRFKKPQEARAINILHDSRQFFDIWGEPMIYLSWGFHLLDIDMDLFGLVSGKHEFSDRESSVQSLCGWQKDSKSPLAFKRTISDSLYNLAREHKAWRGLSLLLWWLLWRVWVRKLFAASFAFLSGRSGDLWIIWRKPIFKAVRVLRRIARELGIVRNAFVRSFVRSVVHAWWRKTRAMPVGSDAGKDCWRAHTNPWRAHLRSILERGLISPFE